MDKAFDLVIRGASVVDGLGAAPFEADVAVKDGRIAQVGRVAGAGAEEIEAKGMLVTPGFVDVHTHYDGQITWENRLTPSSDHGVTTVVMGNCGVGFAPARLEDHDLVIRLMEGVEDIPQVVMAEGVPWTWRTFPEYLDAIEARAGDVDFAAQLPHSPLRVYVMGERGANLESPTEAELAEMRRLTAEAVRAGALGVSTSRNLFHRFRDGRPAPCVHTEIDELQALMGGLKDAGAGVFQINPNLDEDAEQELDILRALAREGGRPVNFSLFAAPRRPDNWPVYVQGLAAARAQGLDITAQFLPRPTGVLFGLQLSLHLFAFAPSYKAIAHLPLADRVARMRDPEVRRRILSEEPDDPNPSLVGMATRTDSLYVLQEPARYSFSPEDALDHLAERTGQPLREVIYDALLGDEGRAILCSFSTDVTSYLPKARQLIGVDGAVIALGDGGAHYATICDAAYTTYALTDVLGRDGIDLPTLIRALTSQSAASVGLLDRGVVAPGYKADLNVIDPDRLELHRPVIACDLPAGGRRLKQKADGYVATIVSGEITYRNGQPTAALPGRLVRGGQPAPARAVVKAAAATAG